jgi:hypothetical protein
MLRSTIQYLSGNTVPSDFSFVALAQKTAAASRVATKMFAKVDKC